MRRSGAFQGAQITPFDPMTPKCYVGGMADVKIRNLEPYIVEAFKVRAKAAGRSLEAELRLALSSQLVGSRAPLLATLDRLREAMPAGSPQSSTSEQTVEDIRAAMAGQQV